MITHIHVESTDSTMDDARQYIKENKPQLPVVITADYQIKGKGQRGRIWDSSIKGGLYYTLITKPEHCVINPIDPYAVAKKITQLIIHKTNLKAEVKKPNDIYINKKKIAGILINTLTTGNQHIPDYIILGIGLNLNQKKWDSKLDNIATSLIVQTGNIQDIAAWIKDITNNLIIVR